MGGNARGTATARRLILRPLRLHLWLLCAVLLPGAGHRQDDGGGMAAERQGGDGEENAGRGQAIVSGSRFPA